MRWSNLARSALFSVAICCVAMPELHVDGLALVGEGGIAGDNEAVGQM
jgi:hypothetical protein